LNAASAKPAPKELARELMLARTWLAEDRNLDAVSHIMEKAAEHISTSEAQLAAERTALKRLKGIIVRKEDELSKDEQMPMEQYRYTSQAFRWVCEQIDEAIDAQEKAGVKAEICNAWHGNDFSQCQLPKGHEGNHLCIMTWEWPTASNAASEQEKSL
jgi:hypothetical protein